MTVAALILAEATDGGAPALARVVDAAWSGGAQPILVAGLVAESVPPLPARRASSSDPASALAEATREVQGTTAIIVLPIAHAGIDPESITTLIAAHGRTPHVPLVAAHEGSIGPVRLLPVEGIATATPESVETGDEAVLVASDGSTRLRFVAPPADREAIDPWEQRGESAEES